MKPPEEKANTVGPKPSMAQTLVPFHPLVQPDVAVVDEPIMDVVTPESIREIGVKLGMTAIDAHQLSAIRTLGVAVEGMGVVNVTRGFTYVSATALLNCITALNERVKTAKDVDELRAIAYPLGYLADKLAKTGKVSVDVGTPAGSSPPVPPNRRASFAAHAVVGITMQVKEK